MPSWSLILVLLFRWVILWCKGYNKHLIETLNIGTGLDMAAPFYHEGLRPWAVKFQNRLDYLGVH